MRTTAQKPATTPIPVQLSDTEFTAFILPHLSMPKRGPKGKLGYHRIFNLILWVLYTGMQWKGLPVPHDAHGQPAIHYTAVYRVFAKWADDGSLWQAFIASVAHLSAEKHLDTSVLHGHGTKDRLQNKTGLYIHVDRNQVSWNNSSHSPHVVLGTGWLWRGEQGCRFIFNTLILLRLKNTCAMALPVFRKRIGDAMRQ